MFSSFQLALQEAGQPACWAPYPKGEESRELNSKEDVSGSICWQLEHRFAHMLGAVGDLSVAGGQVEVVVCVTPVQVLGWWKL